MHELSVGARVSRRYPPYHNTTTIANTRLWLPDPTRTVERRRYRPGGRKTDESFGQKHSEATGLAAPLLTNHPLCLSQKDTNRDEKLDDDSFLTPHKSCGWLFDPKLIFELRAESQTTLRDAVEVSFASMDVHTVS
jgi:hypothetical protein